MPLGLALDQENATKNRPVCEPASAGSEQREPLTEGRFGFKNTHE